MKHYLNAAMTYAIMGMTSGVFYREFTKILEYTERTKLSLMHGHYFTLGLFFFLFLLILEKQFGWSSLPKSKGFIIFYHIGLNITGLAFLIRGLTQVLDISMSKGLNASISGIAGIGHILIAVTMIGILLKVKKSLNISERS
jgi:hypothetical protein